MVADKLSRCLPKLYDCLSFELMLPMRMQVLTYVKQLQNCGKSFMRKWPDEMAHKASAESQHTE